MPRHLDVANGGSVSEPPVFHKDNGESYSGLAHYHRAEVIGCDFGRRRRDDSEALRYDKVFLLGTHSTTRCFCIASTAVLHTQNVGHQRYSHASRCGRVDGILHRHDMGAAVEYRYVPTPIYGRNARL